MPRFFISVAILLSVSLFAQKIQDNSVEKEMDIKFFAFGGMGLVTIDNKNTPFLTANNPKVKGFFPSAGISFSKYSRSNKRPLELAFDLSFSRETYSGTSKFGQQYPDGSNFPKGKETYTLKMTKIFGEVSLRYSFKKLGYKAVPFLKASCGALQSFNGMLTADRNFVEGNQTVNRVENVPFRGYASIIYGGGIGVDIGSSRIISIETRCQFSAIGNPTVLSDVGKRLANQFKFIAVGVKASYRLNRGSKK